MKVTIKVNGKDVRLEASKDTLNYLSIALNEASDSFSARHKNGSDFQTGINAKLIYKQLSESGYYDCVR